MSWQWSRSYFCHLERLADISAFSAFFFHVLSPPPPLTSGWLPLPELAGVEWSEFFLCSCLLHMEFFDCLGLFVLLSLNTKQLEVKVVAIFGLYE